MADKWMSVSELSKKYDRSRTTIINWLHIYDIKKKKKGNTNRWLVWHDEAFMQVASDPKHARQAKLAILEAISDSQIKTLTCIYCDSKNWVRTRGYKLKSGQFKYRVDCYDCSESFGLKVPSPLAELVPVYGEKKARKTNYKRELGPKDSDTPDLVLRDQYRFIREFIENGLSEEKVVDIFGPAVREVARLIYQECINDIRKS